MSHTYETCHLNAPNSGCNRALVLNPFTGRQDCLKMGGNYQCCRIPDNNFSPSEMIEIKTQFTVDIGDTSGQVLFMAVPSAYTPIRTVAYNHGSVTYGGSTQFNKQTPATTIVQNATFASLAPTIQAYRVVAMGLTVEPNAQVMNQQGTIAMANFPADPRANLYNNTYFNNGLNAVMQQPGATMTKTVQGIHCAWLPTSNTTAFVTDTAVNVSGGGSVIVTNPPGQSVSIDVKQIMSTRYEDWQYPAETGQSFPDAYLDSFSTSTVYGDPAYAAAANDMTSAIVVAASGVAPAAITYGVLTCELIQHIEIIPRDVSRAVSPGSVGSILGANLGAPTPAVMTENRMESIKEFAISIGKKAWPVAKQLLSRYGPMLGSAALGFLGI